MEVQHPLSVPKGADPVPVIIGEIQKAREEIRIFQDLISSVYSPGSNISNYISRLRYSSNELPEEEMKKTNRTLIANLEASFLLFHEASTVFASEIETVKKLILSYASNSSIPVQRAQLFRRPFVLSRYRQHRGSSRNRPFLHPKRRPHLSLLRLRKQAGPQRMSSNLPWRSGTRSDEATRRLLLFLPSNNHHID